MNENQTACPVNETTGTIGPVDIARDALKLLDAKEIVAAQGSYFYKPGFYLDNEKDYTILHALRTSAKPCEVCAIGGLFSSFVCKTEDDSPYMVIDLPMRRKLAPYFSREQLGLIEAAFERDSDFALRESAEELDAYAAEDFGFNYEDSDARLRAICQNIIDHKGVFKP